MKSQDSRGRDHRPLIEENAQRRVMPLSGKLKTGIIIDALAGCVTSNAQRPTPNAEWQRAEFHALAHDLDPLAALALEFRR